jgi:glycosyltransferase involved in cell wall biosynthesis
LDWVCERLQPGRSGLSDIVWDTAVALRDIGEDPWIVGAYDAEATVPDAGVPLVRVDRPALWQRNAIGYGVTCLALARALRRVPNVDLVFAAEYLSSPTAAAYYPDLPVVFTTPGNIYERLVYSNPYDWVTTQMFKVAANVAVRRCARVVAISEHMREWWVKTGAPPNRVRVIPHGTDTSVYYPRPHARANLGIAGDEEVVLYAGRLSIEKNLPTLIEAFANVRRQRPRVVLHVLGTGPDEPRLRDLANRLGVAEAIRWHGWVARDRMPDFYSAADIFALPTINEALGRVLLEAMACGTFVIASSFAGPRDIVDDGRNGLLADSTSVAEWQRALTRAFDDPAWRQGCASAGQETVRTHFTWPVVARRLRDEVFAPAVGERRSAA